MILLSPGIWNLVLIASLVALFVLYDWYERKVG